MHRRVPWRDPAVLQLMQNFPTDEIDTGEKLARRISEMISGLKFHQKSPISTKNCLEGVNG